MLPVLSLPLLLIVLLIPARAAAQHHPAAASEVETFVVDGLRVDPEAPPPGSGVGRAGARFSDGAYLHVVYGKPYARGRNIFGGLVAYDQIWATGAHRSTELTTTVAIEIAGKPLAAGVYSLFTTPGKERWRLHLNSALGMHLADEYDAAQDVLVVDATPTVLEEASPGLVIEFLPAEGGVDLRIRWDRTSVAFPIRRSP
jgi:hypothetical protein